MSLKICIMAPDRVFWNAEADEIILPTNTGQMGILPNHTPLITGLDIGVMLVKEKTSGQQKASEWTSMALMGGFALIKGSEESTRSTTNSTGSKSSTTVTILVNDAEFAATIDRVQAEQNFQEAQLAFEKADGRKEKIETSLAYKRARARFQVVASGRP